METLLSGGVGRSLVFCQLQDYMMAPTRLLLIKHLSGKKLYKRMLSVSFPITRMYVRFNGNADNSAVPRRLTTGSTFAREEICWEIYLL